MYFTEVFYSEVLSRFAMGMSFVSSLGKGSVSREGTQGTLPGEAEGGGHMLSLQCWKRSGSLEV